MIEIDLDNIQNQFALYSLTNTDGRLVHLGIVPFKQLTALNDFQGGGIVYMTIIQKDVDRLKLANNGIAWVQERDRNDLHQRLMNNIQSWSVKSNNKSVECIETGEIFSSAADVALQHDLTYGALLKHLKGEKSFNTVKGKTYRKVSDNDR